MSVLVLGSINADLVLRTPRLPRSGETIRATSVARYPGGKGANQAVAAARMGAQVHLVGRVGNDAAGAELLEALRGEGIDTSGVAIDDEEQTGTALITVSEGGDNTIVTSGGANHRVDRAELDAFEGMLPGARVVLVQLEIPIQAVDAAVRSAASAGVAVVLDPAPVRELPDDLYRCATWITPNEHEAAELTGMEDPEKAALELRKRGVENAVVTLGERGCLYIGPAGTFEIPAPKVTAVDTVACGDAFNGALGAHLSGGEDTVDALLRACAAGAAAATRQGAFPSLPGRRQMEDLLDQMDL